MGPGKTLQAIGLILTNPPDGHEYSQKTAQSIAGKNKGPFSTLIVSPVSAKGNRTLRAKEHVKPGILSITTYAGTLGRRPSVAKYGKQAHGPT